VLSAKVRRSEGSNLDSQKRQEFYFHIRVKLALEHIRFPITWERDAFSSGLMGLSREASQSLPSVAEKNVWSYMPNCSFAFMLCSETNCAENIAL